MIDDELFWGIYLMKKKKDKETKIPFRINILLLVIFFMFSGLIIQLGIIQIVEGEAYQAEIDRTIEDTANIPYTRGKIFDRTGKVVVDNVEKYAITYTPPKRVQSADKLDLAEKLVDYMSVSKKQIERVTDFNKREYIFLKNEEEINERVTKEETKDMEDGEAYRFKLNKITDEELTELDDEALEVIAIKRELDKAYRLTPQIIKNENISVNEYARIAENLSELPGISVSVDWDRSYPYEDLLRSILGGVTTQEQGIPAEGEDARLLTGYNRNDRVGKNGLEAYYEDVLRGRKERIKYTTKKTGEIVGSEVITPGEVGKDLQLTMDMDYQKEVDKIVKEELTNVRKISSNWSTTEAIAVAMNPKTGEILALSGVTYDEKNNKYENTPHKALYNAYEPGSSIKGATVLAGFNTGVTRPGDGFYDRPIRMAGPQIKKSLSNTIGYANDLDALKKSSNVYMFYVALRLMGDYRYPFPDNGFVPASSRAEEAFAAFRNQFRQFGLGSSTGIDFPSEGIGLEESDIKAGKVMDYAIGQADTYTALQLAQYVSTIANDGTRVAPKFVNSIHYPSVNDELAGVFEQNDTKIMNIIDVDENEINRVQTGFYKVFNEPGGTGYGYWANKPYKAAGKTGTAQSTISRNNNLYNTRNLTLVGYAPYDDPEIAFAIITPHVGMSNESNSISHNIGTRLLDTYFKAKEKEDDGEASE